MENSRRGSQRDGRPGFVYLESGELFPGLLTRPTVPVVAEVVFTTNMTGYQETFTDPSYMGQMVVMTTPMIGNYGVTAEDMESARPQVSAVVVRELARTPSSWRASASLDDWLGQHDVPLIEGVDTRRLTRYLRDKGAMLGVIAEGESAGEAVLQALREAPCMAGRDLASEATVTSAYREGSGPHIVAYDFGMKRHIVEMLVTAGFSVTVVPSRTTADEVRNLNPDGIFLSNGPGDPAAVSYVLPEIRALGDSGLPTFGICLGHQLLGLAYGARTEKMPYGHRGGNHPVKDLASGKVLITTQNHGFAVVGDESGVYGAPDLELTHRNLNDGSVEGLRHRSLPLFAVQYHPEAAPGPHDAYPHFDSFRRSVGERSRKNGPTS